MFKKGNVSLIYFECENQTIDIYNLLRNYNSVKWYKKT